MNTSICIRDVDSKAFLTRFAQRRIDAHLGRFAPRISRISLVVEDVNGPRGGVDKRCRIHVLAPRLEPQTAEALEAGPQAAVDAAISKLAAGMGRALERTRRTRAGAPSIRRAS